MRGILKSLSALSSLKQPSVQTSLIWETVWDAGNTKILKMLSVLENQFNWKVHTNQMWIYRTELKEKWGGTDRGYYGISHPEWSLRVRCWGKSHWEFMVSFEYLNGFVYEKNWGGLAAVGAGDIYKGTVRGGLRRNHIMGGSGDQVQEYGLEFFSRGKLIGKLILRGINYYTHI